MENLIILVRDMIFSNNIVLVFFLGLCPFLGVSKNPKEAFSIGVAFLVMLPLTGVLNHLLFYHVLVPLQAQDLYILSTVLFTYFIVHIVYYLSRKKAHEELGKHLPMLVTNCALVGIVFFNLEKRYTLIESYYSSLGAGIGFLLVLLIYSFLRTKLDTLDIPRPFKGLSLSFIVAGILSMALLGFI